jgi:hypothetical protein
MDPNTPIDVTMRIDSPQVLVYRLWFKRPDDNAWTIFATGTDEDAASATGHAYQIGPLPSGSRISYQLIFSGNPQTTYRAEIVIAQGGEPLPGGEIDIEGTTDDGGVATAKGEVAL